MLSDLEYLYFANGEFNLSAIAKSYIKKVRTSDPSRLVGTYAPSNVVSFVSSRKMGQTISTESHTAEGAFVVLAEFDERIYEYWEQTDPIKVIRHDRHGRRRHGTYTPDFLSLGEHGAELVEVKTRDKVTELAKHYPKDWVINADLQVRYLPGERAAQELGLGFRVFVYEPSLRYLVNNLKLMLRARHADDLTQDLSTRVKTALTDRFTWSMEDLADHLGLKEYTGLIQLIDKQVVHTDLRCSLLSQPAGCILALTQPLLEHAVHLLDREKIQSSSNPQTSQSILRVPSQACAERVLDKLARLSTGESSRSARRWRAQIKKGRELGLTDFQCLIPRVHQQGNRLRKISQTVDKFVTHYLWEEHGRLQGISDYRSYVRYRTKAQEAHLGEDPVSERTFRRRLLQLPAEHIARQRGGKRLANAAADASPNEDRALRAQLPWQRASIDHGLARLFLVYFASDETIYIQRPWITAMVDQCTGLVLATTISFLPPSRRAVCKVFRDCVRLHGRLPEEVIVDRGAEFQSTYMTSLQAHYKVDYSLRPAGHPRYGSEVERFFGEFKQCWLTQRPGNMTDRAQARTVDGAMAPRNMAILRPVDFIRELSLYRQWRQNKVHAWHALSPGAQFRELATKYPFLGKLVDYDDEFLLVTAVECNKFTVDQRRGIHTSGRWYYSPELRRIRGRKRPVEVRLDPENPHLIYALVGDLWVTCHSSSGTTFSALDGPSQLAQGLTQLETSTLRRRIQLEQDEHLARLVRELDNNRVLNTDFPVLVTDNCNKEILETENTDDWLSDLNLEDLTPLKAESWGARE